jgi:hypothetical protein
MTGGLDIRKEREKALRLASEALAEARRNLAEIKERIVGGEEIDQKIIDRVETSISQLEDLTK